MHGKLMLGMCLVTLPAHAGFLDGNKMLDLCRHDAGFVQGYVAGILDRRENQVKWLLPRVEAAPTDDLRIALGDDLLHIGGNLCNPEGVTLGQATGVVCKHIKENPENRHEPAEKLVVNALEGAWPCIK